MFKIFHKNKEINLHSPVIGRMINLKDVPDNVFATKMMGDGVAFILEDDVVCAPCNGVITLIPETLHAFGIKADNGAEILVHIGLDTVNLNGYGFQKLVEQGEKVEQGQPILKVNRNALLEKGAVLTTPMVVTNSADFNIETSSDIEINYDSVVINCKRN